MKYLLILYFLCLIFPVFADNASVNPSSFSASTSLSSENISIDQLLTLQTTLTYPSNFHPNFNLMRQRLLSYAGLNESPFTFIKDNIHQPKEKDGVTSQQIDFLLSPQLAGKHFLTFYSIQFDPNAKEGKSFEVPSEVFSIDVVIPKIQFNLAALIEPPMALSQELPINLSQENKKEFLQNPLLNKQEAEKNKAFLKGKAFPWLPILAAFAVAMVFLLAKILPSKSRDEEVVIMTREKKELEIKNELDEMALNIPKEAKEASGFITHLDFLMRQYFVTHYQFPAFSFTTQELINKTASMNFTPSINEGLKKIFKNADQVKFANLSPNPNECIEMVETAKALTLKQVH